MPIIQSAKKRMRQDKKREAHNEQIKLKIKTLAKNMRKNPSQEALQKASSALDKAAKVNFIHKNKASRLKSRLAKHLSQPSA